MDGFVQDLRHAVRALIRRPGFSLVTVVTLGLGIGATTAMFSTVHTVLLRPLPYAESENIVAVFQGDVTTGERGAGVSAANIQDLMQNSDLLSAVAVAEPWSLDLQVDGRTESLRTWVVSQGFFEAAAVTPVLGRTFLPEEYLDGTSSVLMSEGTWVDRFGADPAIVGSTLSLDGGTVTVVGVLPRAFRFPDAAEFWAPRVPRPDDAPSRAADYMAGIGRIAPGATVTQARAEAERIASALREAYPRANRDMTFQLVPLREHLFGDVRTPLFVILAAVGLVLLIACANVAGLMLARGAQREREFALRGALGAGTGRLVSHVTAESLVLAGAGCALGVALTYAGVWAVQALGPDHLPRIDELRVDGTVLAFAGIAGGLSAILSGIAPSVRLSRPDLRGALSDGSRGSTGGQGESRIRARLVVTEIAAAVVLLVGAGLLLRSFGMILDKDLGFEPENRLALQVFAYGYSGDDGSMDQATFIQRTLEEMSAIPGVEDVAITTNIPAANDGIIASIDITVPFTIVDRDPPPEGQEPMVGISAVTPSYFDVMGIDVVAGRGFDAGDGPDGAPVVIVNEALVRRHFPNQDPIGQSISIRFGRQPVDRMIVGVIGDTRPLGHTSEPRPEAVRPLAQALDGSLTYVLKGNGEAARLTAPAMEAVWRVNASQAVWGSAPVEALVGDWLKERRFSLFLLSAFSVVALTLAAVGIYGLISFSVQRRLGELGIRRALGGQTGDLIRMVLGEGARLAGLGVLFGLVAALFLSRFIQGMLFDVAPSDPLTFAGLAVLVLVIATAATLVPAIRATRVDPVVALRSE